MPSLDSSNFSVPLPSLRPKDLGGASRDHSRVGRIHDRASNGIKQRSLPGSEQQRSPLSIKERRKSTGGVFPDRLQRTEEQLTVFQKQRRNSHTAGVNDHVEAGARHIWSHGCSLPDRHQPRRPSSSQNEPMIDTFDSEFLPTVDDAVARYRDASFTDTERQRMRLAYIRFAVADASEVQVAYLQDILIHLGYLTATDKRPRDIEFLAAQVTPYTTLDFHEVHDVASRFARSEIATISNAASELRASGTRYLDKLLQVFHSLGVITCEDVITEALDMANAHLNDQEKYDECVDQHGILRVIAAYQSMEGFTAEERARAKQIFDERDRFPSTRRSAMTGCLVKASELTKGLVKFFGPYYAPYIEQLQGKIPDTADAPGLSFYEFLIWARRVRDIGMRAIHAAFEHGSADGDGRMSAERMLRTVALLGFTLLDNAADEILQKTGLHRGQESIDFSTFVRFLSSCHRTHGFTDGERQRFLDLYAHFDRDRNDELESTEIINMLRFQGHTTRLSDAHKIIRRVDFNQNGTMDRSEFLRFMRLQREQVLVTARRAYDTVRKSSVELPTRKMAQTLAQIGIELRSEELEGLERANEGHGATLPFEAFVRIMFRAQEIAAVDGRKRAFFSIPTIEALRREFQTFDKAKAGFVGTRDIIFWIMSQAKVSAQTRAERESLISTTDAARKAALEAGCSEVEVSAPGYGSKDRITFWLFIHLVGSFVQMHEENVSNREKEACEETKFSQVEVAQFRQLFSQAVDDCFKHGTFGSVLEDLFAEPALPRKSIGSLLSSIGLRVSLQQHRDLDEKLKELIESDSDAVGFASFLKLMCWILRR